MQVILVSTDNKHISIMAPCIRLFNLCLHFSHFIGYRQIVNKNINTQFPRINQYPLRLPLDLGYGHGDLYYMPIQRANKI